MCSHPAVDTTPRIPRTPRLPGAPALTQTPCPPPQSLLSDQLLHSASSAPPTDNPAPKQAGVVTTRTHSVLTHMVGACGHHPRPPQTPERHGNPGRGARGPAEPSVERCLQHCGTVRGTVLPPPRAASCSHPNRDLAAPGCKCVGRILSAADLARCGLTSQRRRRPLWDNSWGWPRCRLLLRPERSPSGDGGTLGGASCVVSGGCGQATALSSPGRARPTRGRGSRGWPCRGRGAPWRSQSTIASPTSTGGGGAPASVLGLVEGASGGPPGDFGSNRGRLLLVGPSRKRRPFRLVHTHPVVDVPVQYFQSVVAIEMAVAGARFASSGNALRSSAACIAPVAACAVRTGVHEVV